MTYLIKQGHQNLGSIYRKGFFSKCSQADLPENWPVALQAFVFTLVFILWKRFESAAVAGS